jgi:hypothetical protein
VLVRVTDPDRLVDLIVFLRNSGFPLAQRQGEGVAKLHSQEDARVREAIALWEAHSGAHAEVIG